jgi:hypothetical protein
MELQALRDSWNAANEPSRWTDDRWNGQEQHKARKPKRQPEPELTPSQFLHQCS